MALAAGNNSPEEAATAAARAQELMFKYQIGEADLDLDGAGKREVEEVVDESIFATSKRVVWRATLAYGIARALGCTLYTDQSGNNTKYQVVGIKSVVQTVSYMFLYLANEVERLADEAWVAERANGRQAAGSARTWKNNFRMGAINVIVSRLKEQHQAQTLHVEKLVRTADAATVTALALYKTDQERVVEQYEKIRVSKGLRSLRSSFRVNPSAYQRGRTAGGSVSLGGGKSLGAPNKQVRS